MAFSTILIEIHERLSAHVFGPEVIPEVVPGESAFVGVGDVELGVHGVQEGGALLASLITVCDAAGDVYHHGLLAAEDEFAFHAEGGAAVAAVDEPDHELALQDAPDLVLFLFDVDVEGVDAFRGGPGDADLARRELPGEACTPCSSRRTYSMKAPITDCP